MIVWIAIGLVLLSFGLLWWIHRNDRQQTAYERQLAELTAAVEALQVALGEAMLPAVRRANEAFRDFGEAWRKRVGPHG